MSYPNYGGGGGYGQQQAGYGGQQGGYGGQQGGYGQQQPAGGYAGGYAPPPGPPSYGGGGGGYGAPGGQPGGFASHRAPPAPPPNADPQLWSWFSSVDLDHSGAISAEELQRALINGDWSHTVKMLMTIFDTDRSGTIGFAEFTGLWKYIKDWQGVFRHFDRDSSGSIDGTELNDALRQFGFNLNPQLLRLLLAKYGAQSPSITFDRFVRACVVVKSITESFQRHDTRHRGVVELNYEQFMQVILALP